MTADLRSGTLASAANFSGERQFAATRRCWVGAGSGLVATPRNEARAGWAVSKIQLHRSQMPDILKAMSGGSTMMSTGAPTWTDADTAKARQIWADYQRRYDVMDRQGQAVGIDPASGRVWFGKSAKDIALRLDAEGVRVPLFFLRVGQDYYGRKGGRR